MKDMEGRNTHPDSEALGFPGDRIRYVYKMYEKKATLIYVIKVTSFYEDTFSRACVQKWSLST